MPRKKSNKDRYNFLIDRSIYDDFSSLCEEQGLVRSKKIELFMRSFIEENKKELDRLKK